MRIRFLFILFIFSALHVSAQQPSLYSQYMFNELAINPAYAGSQEYIQVTALARRQWAALHGSPTTLTLTAHAPVKNQKMALGFLLYNDHISVFNQTGFNAIYAYRIKLDEQKNLSFGLQAGFDNYTALYSQLTHRDANDPSLPEGDISSFRPEFGAGVYYRSTHLTLGASAPKLMNDALGNKTVFNNFTQRNYYLFRAGYAFSISPTLKCQPNMLVKYSNGQLLQADLSFVTLYKQTLWAGISYRSFNSLVFLCQLNLSNQLRVGYAYDQSLGALSKLNSGSHELMVNYSFYFVKTKIVSPRYF